MTGAAARLFAWSLLLVPTVALAQPEELPTLVPSGRAFDVEADRFEALSADRYLMEGNVTFRAAGVLLQADRITYDRATRRGEAVGNVLYVQGTGRIAGDSVTFDLGARTAEITNATGYLDQGFLFRARRIEQLDDQRIRFEKGFFTACTQPVPYWSFRVGRGLVIRNRYVHLYNLRLKAGVMPVFYSPYLVFPIKPDRATGLLLPQIGFSQRLGSSLSNAFFWAPRRNTDATFFMDAYSEGSLGGGVEHRLVPNARGATIFNAYLIDEENAADSDEEERRRWNVRYKQRQDFRSGARLLADFNFVSDADYYLDFSRDLDRGSDPSALSRAEYVFHRGHASYNLRSERREQFFADDSVIQSRLPEVEMRVRSNRLGRSPFFFALESSASLLDKSGPNFPDGAYARIDVFPTVSAPMTPAPWLDITPTLRLRETYYSKALDPNQPDAFGDDLSREFMQFDLQLLGPRLSRVVLDAEGGGRYKSTIEPRFVYRYQTTPQAEDNLRVPGFDEIDILPGDLNELEYGIVSRLLARRRVRTPGAADRGGDGDAAQDVFGSRPPEEEAVRPPPGEGSIVPSAPEEPPPVPAEGAAPALPAAVANLPGETAESVDTFSTLPVTDPGETILTSPVEIASFFMTQRYSLMAPLSFDLEFIDTTGDGLLDTLETVDDSRFSPITLGGRYNPSANTSIDGKVGLDVLENAVASASLSAGLHDPGRGFLNATWFFRNGLDGRTRNSSRLRVSGGGSFWRRKISMAVSLNYDATLSVLQDQRYRFGYDTQCCGFAVEVLEREFVGTDQREFRFVVNLRGIGNFLDLQGRGEGR